jgi:hypothetical protein
LGAFVKPTAFFCKLRWLQFSLSPVAGERVGVRGLAKTKWTLVNGPSNDKFLGKNSLAAAHGSHEPDAKMIAELANSAINSCLSLFMESVVAPRRLRLRRKASRPDDLV